DRADDDRLVAPPRLRLHDRATLADARLAARRWKNGVDLFDAHAGIPASNRSGRAASSSWMLSQIRSSYSRNFGSRFTRRLRGRPRSTSISSFTRPGRLVNTITRSAR